MPPLAIFKVPDRVTAPVVAVEGVNPVVPALNEETIVPKEAHAGTPATTVRICPELPIANLEEVFAPLP